MTKLKYTIPKNIPQELFHGTSLSRWKFINGHGLLVNQHKICREIQEDDNRIYLTIDPNDAAFYGLKTTEMEKRLSKNELKKTGIIKRKNDAVIISVDTSGLKIENLYLDPEDVNHEGWFVYFGNIPVNSIKKYSVTRIQQVPESVKARLFCGIGLSNAIEKKDERKLVDTLEIHIIKSNELGLEFDLLQQLKVLKNYDKVATKGKFFPKVEKELIQRGMINKSQIENI